MKNNILHFGLVLSSASRGARSGRWFLSIVHFCC
jgi:hypothetical protein